MNVFVSWYCKGLLVSFNTKQVKSKSWAYLLSLPLDMKYFVQLHYVLQILAKQFKLFQLKTIKR